MKKNNKCMLCGDRDKTVYYMKESENFKLTQNDYKTKHDWVGKVIHWELCKPEFVLENETYKILSDFEIQIDHPISPRQPDLMLIKKKKEFVIYWILPFRQNTE